MKVLDCTKRFKGPFEKPACMMKVGNKTLLELNLERIKEKKVMLIVNDESIMTKFQDNFKGIELTYCKEEADACKTKFSEELKEANNLGELKIDDVWDLLEANEEVLKKIQKPQIGKGTKILPGVHIEGNVVIGDNCKIGPNCYIRGSTTIGNNCRIGQSVEIKNSIINDNTNVGHLSYVGDSILGDNVNFAAGTVVANLRHDDDNVKVKLKDLKDSNRRKLGVIIGDGAKTGINTSFYPGRMMYPNTFTQPGEIVKENKRSTSKNKD